MNVTTMKEPPSVAREKLRQYERELNRAGDDELSEVLVGLEAMVEGFPVIHLSQAIREGGHDELGRPNLAVARADRKRVKLFSNPRRAWSWRRIENRLTFSSYKKSSGGGRRHNQYDKEREDYDGDLIVSVGVDWSLSREGHGYYADVPLTPPGPRRKAGGKTRLKDHLVLWEVEEWHKDRTPRPPEDPMLLRPLGGEMYAVVAEWDLTPLERAVIAGRQFSG